MNPSYWFAVGLLALLGWITRVQFHFLVAGLLVGLGGAIQLWSRFALRGVKLRRSLVGQDPAVGDPIGMRIDVENPRPLAVPWLRIDDRVGHKRLAYLLSIGPYQSVSFEDTTLAAERGVLPTGPAVLRTADPFGFRVSRLDGDPTGSILIRPLRVSLSGSSIRNERQEPGDVLDRGLAQHGRVHVVLDLVGEGIGTERGGAAIPAAAIETAISVAAAAATRVLDAGGSVALDSNGLASGRRGRLRIRGRAGAEQKRRIGGALARVRPGGRIGLPSLLRRALPLAPSSPLQIAGARAAGEKREERPLVLVITVGGCPRARRYLRRLEKEGDDVLVWSIGDGTWFPGSLHIEPGAAPVGEPEPPCWKNGDVPQVAASLGETSVSRARLAASMGELDRLLLVAVRAILRLCWVWPWLRLLSFVSSPQRGTVLSLRALVSFVIGSWIFGLWMRRGSRPRPREEAQARRSARGKAWVRVVSAIAALLVGTWFFEFRSIVMFTDTTWLHILGEDLLAGGGRALWRVAGILAGIHVWLGTLFDTEERVDRGALWSGFMVTLSFLVALAALLPVIGLPAELAPTRELLLSFAAVLIGLLRSGLDLGRTLEPTARYVVSLQRKSLFSWGLLGSQLRGRNGR